MARDIDEIRSDVGKLPDEELPDIEELTGDLRMLADIVGVRAALRVSQAFNGTPIRLYGCKKWILRYRDRCIRRDADKGMSGLDLGRKYGIGERRIWQILGQAEPEV